MNLQHELLNYSPKNSRKLKTDAIPTENLPSSKALTESIIKRQDRQEKKQRKEIVNNILYTSILTYVHIFKN